MFGLTTQTMAFRTSHSPPFSRVSGSCTTCISHIFFFNDTATTEIYTSSHTLSLHDALPISARGRGARRGRGHPGPPAHERRSEEHTSELPSRELISYAVFCMKKKNQLRHNEQELAHHPNLKTHNNTNNE